MQINIEPRTKAQVPPALLAVTPAAIVGLSTDDMRKAAQHREIARRYARPRRKGSRPSIVSLIIGDLEKFFADKYGAAFPDDDAGRDDLIVLLHYVMQLGDQRALRARAARWCPWLSGQEYAAMIAGIERKPLRWRADSLAREIGLNRATRTRLGVTTIGATDFGKAKRTKRRTKLNNADKLARRAAAGAKPHAESAEQKAPWLALGISRRTYYRRQANGTVGTDSGTAARIYMGAPKQCHTTQTGASPEGESAAQACAPVPDAGTASTVYVDRVSQTKRDTAVADRLGLHWIRTGKNPFEYLPSEALESTDTGRAAA